MKTEEKELRVLEYLEGELTAEQEQALIRDAASDAELAELLADYQQQERALESYFTARGDAARNISRPDLRRLPVAVASAQPATAKRNRRVFVSLAIAAGLAAATGSVYFLSSSPTKGDLPPVTVAAAVGKPQMITANGSLEAITPEMKIAKAVEKFKTPDGSRLELALGKNGGSVELNSNSTVELRRAMQGTTVKLNRGEIVVWPAATSSTPLSVTTPQLQANALEGSAFSVVRGLRGSEVAVLKGEVEVVQAGARRKLREGESYSSAGVTPLPVIQRVAWSAKGRQVAAALPASSMTATNANGESAPVATTEIAMATNPATNAANDTGEPTVNVKEDTITGTNTRVARTTGAAVGVARTTDYLPTGTFSLVEIPNFSALSLTSDPDGNIREGLKKTSIRGILEQNMKNTGASQAHIDEAIARMEQIVTTEELDLIKNSLGGSISIGITEKSPIFIGELTENADRIGAIFSQKINPWVASETSPNEPQLMGAVQNGLLVVGLRGPALDETLAATASFRPTPFRESALMTELRGSVAQSRFTVAVDMAVLRSLAVGSEVTPNEQLALEYTGLVNMRSIVAATSFSDQAQNRAMRVNFDGERRGMMNWLGEPAALNSLQFFSPDAQFIAAARIRKPEQMLDELLRWSLQQRNGASMPTPDEGLALQQRIAATLGNEIAIGLDNPILPVPNVKVAIEVNDPIGFHDAMIELVESVSRNRPPEEQVQLDSRTYRDCLIVNMKFPRSLFDVSYAVVGDYVVFGPGAAFLERSVDMSLSGASIDHEAAFMDALPAKSGSFVSMLVYTPGGKSLGEAAPVVQAFLQRHHINVDLTRATASSDEAKPIVAYAVAEGNSIDLFVNGVKGDYQMAGALPLVSDWLAMRTGQ